MKFRKVIQITPITDHNGDIPAMIALCDDGTMWGRSAGEDWEIIRNVPQRPLSADERSNGYEG